MAYDLSRLSVLVVDDDEFMRRLIGSTLRAMSFGRVDVAEDGVAALEMTKRKPADIVVTDCLMQPMNGIELVRAVRTDPEIPNPYVPIIMITALGEAHHVTAARDAGATEFLVKPFTIAGLFERIRYVIEEPRKFVRTASYFGPDRRRRPLTEYCGPERRSSNDDQHVVRPAIPVSLDAPKSLRR